MSRSKFLTVGNVFKDTFYLYKKNFVKLAVSILVLFIPIIVIGVVLVSRIGFESIGLYINNSIENMDFSSIALIYGATFIIYIPLGTLYCIYNYRVLYFSFIGREETFSEFLSIAAKKTFKFIGLYFLYLLIISGCMIPIVAVSFLDNSIILVLVFIAVYILIIWVSIALLFSFFILSVEETTIIESLKGSWNLTLKKRGSIFALGLVAIFGFYGVFFVIALLIGGSTILFSSSGSLNISDAYLSTLIMPLLMFIFSIVLYPLVFSFNGAVFINLKKEKGILPADELVNEFMVEEKDDYTQW